MNSPATEVPNNEEPIKADGSCLCGKVTYKAALKPGAGACHCTMCRKWCGGPLMTIHAIGAVHFEGTEHIGTFSSSEWAERGFCKHCGSSLFYHLLPRPGLPDGEYSMLAGTVTDQRVMKFDHEVFVDQAPGWYQFSDESERRRMTEADIFAMYGSGD